MAEMIGSFYVGFGPTLGGALIGALWGFAVGFVFFAWRQRFTTGWSASAGTEAGWAGLPDRPTDAIKKRKVKRSRQGHRCYVPKVICSAPSGDLSENASVCGMR